MNTPGPAMTEGLTLTAKKKEAVWAFCLNHQMWISGGLYWDLPTTINLHLTGIGSETYSKVRNIEWKPCQLKLYKWAAQ